MHQKAHITLSPGVHLQKNIHACLIKPVQEKNISPSQQNQRINAIKFYDEKVPGREKTYYGIDRPRRQRKLPDVLSKEADIRYIQEWMGHGSIKTTQRYTQVSKKTLILKIQLMTSWINKTHHTHPILGGYGAQRIEK